MVGLGCRNKAAGSEVAKSSVMKRQCSRFKCSFIEQQGKVKQARVRGNNRCHVGRAESATGTMQRSGQAADREDITRQAGSRRQAANGQSRIGSPGKQNTGEMLRISAGAKQDFATCVGKCAAYMWVSE